MRKLRKAYGKAEWGSVERLKDNKPAYKVDHIVKERWGRTRYRFSTPEGDIHTSDRSRSFIFDTIHKWPPWWFWQVSDVHRRSAGRRRRSVHVFPLLYVRAHREVPRAGDPAVPQTQCGVDELHHRFALAQKGRWSHSLLRGGGGWNYQLPLYTLYQFILCLPRPCTLYPASVPFTPPLNPLYLYPSPWLCPFHAASLAFTLPYPSRRLCSFHAASVPFTLPLYHLSLYLLPCLCLLCATSLLVIPVLFALPLYPLQRKWTCIFWVDAFLQSDLHYLLSFRSVVQPPSYQCPSSTY